MQEVFKKIIEKLEKHIDDNCDNCKEKYNLSLHDKNYGIHEAIEIIKQTEAEYNNGWIPCSEPPKIFKENRELIPFLVCDEESQYPYRALYDGKNWGDGFSKLNPIAWQPLPEPYQPKVKRDE